MKKLILVFAVIAITAGAYAQTDSTSIKVSQPDINNTDEDINQDWDVNNGQNQTVHNNPIDKSNPDGVMMQNGKTMMVKNGKMTILDHEMTMSNGTKITSDGNYIKKDGTKKMMKEGQHIDNSGNITTIKTNKDKELQLVPDSTMNKDQ